MGKYSNVRKLLGVLVAALALGSGAFGARQVDLTRERTVRVEVARAAEAASARANESLGSIAADLELKAQNAAANPRLGFALQGNVDERTLRDLWRTEEWWRPWRSEFAIYAVARTGGGALDVVEGIDPAVLDLGDLLRRAATARDAVSAIVVGKGWPYAATATAVRVPGRERPPLLLLAKPIDQALLGRLSDKAGGAVLVSDGRRALMQAGPEAERAKLVQAIGTERATPTFMAADGDWAARAHGVAPGLWLWTFVSATAATTAADTAARERTAMVWAVAGVLAAAILVLTLRRSAAPVVEGAGGTRVAVRPEGALPPSPATTRGVQPATLLGPGGPVGGPAPIDGAAATAVAHTPVRPAPATDAASFGRYTLLDRLGEGGMAEVYTAVTYGAEGFRRKFVIKRLRAELARDPAAVAQFIDEANLASSMVHSNVVPVFDFGKVGEEYFLAQEYILGRDLTRLTRRCIEREGRALPPEVVAFVATETLKGLEYAHTKSGETGAPLGIVHRDVSPSNVIVSARGEVKLFDFGIVKAEGRVTKTQTGVVKGNVTFMAPEQAQGLAVDARADLFSLGLVLYHCLTGRVLYSGNTTYELLVKAATGPGPDQQQALAALPAPWADLLQRTLQARPDDRFQSARELADAISARAGTGGATALAALMNRLFADDFRDEEARVPSVG